MSKVKQIRPLGEITGDLELLYEEMIDEHDLQVHEILGLFFFWCQVHRPDAFETYVSDGSSPEIFYGPTRSKKK